MSAGGICYGYDLIPGQTGARKINQVEAAVVVRIFEEYAAGRSPQAITTQLNKEQVPGPRGRPWRHTTIRGHITRGTGILNTELYIGKLVWNRQRFMKDRRHHGECRKQDRAIDQEAEVPLSDCISEVATSANSVTANPSRPTDRASQSGAVPYAETPRAISTRPMVLGSLRKRP